MQQVRAAQQMGEVFPRETNLTDRQRLQLAASLFVRQVPADMRECVRMMAHDYGVTIETLVYDVWRERIERWAARARTELFTGMREAA